MAGILKVDKYQDFNGNDIMTSDGSGNITMPSGIISGQNYPAFEAYAAAEQTGIADNTWTKVIFDTELFDTNSMYDATTNYRFTPTVSGKYFVYLGFPLQSTTVNSGTVFNISIYKNGSSYKYTANAYNTAEGQIYEYVGAVINFNGSTDYVEAFGRVNVSSGTAAFDARITQGIFGAYRIGA
jgi:hypothetical protein